MARLKKQLNQLKGSYRNEATRKKVQQATQALTRKELRFERMAEQLPPDNRLTHDDIVNYKDRMEEVIAYANSRIDAAMMKQQASIELDRFLQGDVNKRFDISDIDDPGELRSYMTMVRNILPTISEDSEKALIDTAFLARAEYEGQFGNQWREIYKDEEGRSHYRHYNIHDVVDDQGNVIRKAIDPEIASKAFEAYRKIEKEFAGYIGHQGAEGVYGSENLIIAIYDSYSKGEDGQLFAHDLMNAWITKELGHLEGIRLSLDDAQAIITTWDDYIGRRAF